MPDPTVPSTTCQASCATPTPDGVHLCRTHVETLVSELDLVPDTVVGGRTIPGLVSDLQVTVTRQSRMACRDAGARSAETPLPWNDRASRAALELGAILAAWCHLVSEVAEDERDSLSAIHGSETGELARWLVRNVHTAARHDQAGTLYAEICDAVTEAKRVVDKPIDPSPFGMCGAEDEHGDACQEYLYAPRGREWITCRCGARHSAKERLDWMLSRCQNLNGPASRIASWLLMFGITATADAVRGMARRNQIRPLDPQSETPRFKLVDVVTAYTRSRSRAARQDVAA